MTTTLEKVARAILARRAPFTEYNHPIAQEIWEANKAQSIKEARAAIQALMEHDDKFCGSWFWKSELQAILDEQKETA